MDEDVQKNDEKEEIMRGLDDLLGEVRETNQNIAESTRDFEEKTESLIADAEKMSKTLPLDVAREEKDASAALNKAADDFLA